MDEIRRVQVTGGSTFIISLPKKWVKAVGLKPGNAVLISTLKDGSLIVRPYKEETREDVARAELYATKDESFDKLVREFVSRYLVGYNIIAVYFERGMSTQKEQLKKFVREKLIGVELLEESAQHLLIQCLVKYDELPLNKALERMSAITQFMIEDAIKAFIELDSELAEEVVKRDDEVDRFYLFAVRQLKHVIRDITTLYKIGLKTPRDCLGYRIIVKSIERIADHAARIASIATKLNKKVSPEITEEINKFAKLALNLFKESIDALLELNAEKAHNIIDMTEKAAEYEEKLTSLLMEKEETFIVMVTKLVLESLKRIAEYSSDIAEIVINLSVGQP
ncbi:MAG: hypothetical protein DRN64_04350 [Thaumarchaeota archaeon]|nr:MAG: hypothetical protein DRN64_04350 [Nitrososphaerota archaeon]